MNPRTIRTLIADDERPARELLLKLLVPHTDFEIIGEVEDGEECLKAIRDQKPDIVFLDIQMPRFTGIEVLAELSEEEMPIVVFVTAYNEFAVAAFDFHALDYLLKPFKSSRFEESIARIRLQLSDTNAPSYTPQLKQLVQYYKMHPLTPDAESGNFLQRVFVQKNGRSMTVETADILYFEAVNQYTRVHESNGNHILSYSLSRFEDELNPRQFVRIHRKYLVNLNCVETFETDRDGTHLVVLPNETRLPVSRRRVAALKEVLGTG